MASSRSRNADEGNLHFPLKLSKGADGRSLVTCNLAPKKVWGGDTDEKAIRAARNELKTMQERAQLADDTPAWSTSGEWKMAKR